MANPKDSPHVQQVFRNPSSNYESRTDIEFSRILRPSDARMTYRRRQHEIKTVIHWGQRKLLLSEIEFLTMYGHEASLVVYAGAAPGTHIKQLAIMFKTHKFVLVDPAPFTVKEAENILCRQEMFTDDVAKEFVGRATLFISDIRSADWSELEEEENEKRVKGDQVAQMTWHEIMKPKYSMLKFRLPWGSGQTEYLDGTIYLPIFGPITTTETRLIVKGDAKTRLYDNTLYEEQLFYFNTITRVAVYGHDVEGDQEGLDHCYDCRAEVHVLEEYLKKIGKNNAQNVLALSHDISRACAKGRTLASPNSDLEERKSGIRNRQWIEGRPAYETRSEASSSRYSEQSRRMMENMGYKKDRGLGKDEQGMTVPLIPKQKRDQRGLDYNDREFTKSFSSDSSDKAAHKRKRDYFPVEHQDDEQIGGDFNLHSTLAHNQHNAERSIDSTIHHKRGLDTEDDEGLKDPKRLSEFSSILVEQSHQAEEEQHTEPRVEEPKPVLTDSGISHSPSQVDNCSEQD